ncbi:MAG: SoxY-related AACIE arm protein [Betaproteobacteria bacterium]|nr:SoxY-related AACIE arm protein [Betaproteobacteria bacterium]
MNQAGGASAVLRLTRRQWLALAAGGFAVSAWPRAAQAQLATFESMVLPVSQGAPVRRGKVRLTLPVLAENGNAVPMKVAVDSAMSPDDHVKAIHLLSERNPVKNMAVFYLGPRAGRAEVNTRVRLAGSQRVVALAHLSDGSFWYDQAEVIVTLSACVDGT